MIRSSLLIKNLVAIFSIAVVSFVSATISFAQCEGIYFKPTGKTPTDTKVLISPLQEDIAGDFNGDGKLDLVGIETSGPNTHNKLFIYFGDGTGKFGSRTVINLPESLERYYGSYVIRDFNADGKMDLIVGTVSNTLVYLNDGTGAFAVAPPATFGGGQVINAADLNGDSLLDLISGTSYRMGNANGTFGSSAPLPAGADGRYLGDFDGDGDIDLVVRQSSGGNSILKIAYNQGNGTFVVGNQSVSLGGDLAIFEAVKDLNNDGKADLAVTSYGTLPKLMILLSQGNDSFTKTDYVLNSSPNISFTETGDYNGDGFVDFLNRIHTQPGTYSSGYIVSLNNGAGAFTQRTYQIGGLDTYDDRSVGDFNGDGKTDFIRINNAVPSGFTPSTIFNDTQFTVKIAVCDKFGQPKIIDFDRDQRTNQAVWRDSDGRWRYQYSLTEINPIVTTFNWGASGDRPVPGDYDGDGVTDAAVFRSGVWYIRNSADNTVSAVTFGASEDKLVPADYNGDGRTDIAVYRQSNGIWYFLMSGTNQFSAAQFGASEDVPVPEDYDGDGKTDIAVFRPSQGFWYVLRSSNNSYYGAQWGLGTDDAHPADYDGDGKADFCVRRRSNNYWYILRSSNNQTGAIPFGITEDVAQTGDWDGNGVMDIGIYRPGVRQWYTTGTPQIFYSPFGEANEIPVATVQR